MLIGLLILIQIPGPRVVFYIIKYLLISIAIDGGLRFTSIGQNRHVYSLLLPF